ncbi:hypothetical protein [Flavobacterium sp.]|uniref:hypothetical protein n=1 Tax=Flavobacterium sp. TaxID=239 RepID=UPI004047B61A
MDIQTRKINFVQAFLQLQNEAVIFEMEKLLQKNTLTRESYTQELEKANERIEKGSFLTIDEVKKKVNLW